MFRKPYIIAALLSISTVFGVEFMPPTSGKFFYSDFWLDQSNGFHEMNMYDAKT
jgi:hypothetical protein